MTGNNGAVYVFDTSAILDCWVRFYPKDVFPGLYENLDLMIAAGTFISSEEVYRELEHKDDGAFAWAKDHRPMFLPLDNPIQVEAASILTSHPRLVEAGGRRSVADPFVIALAKVKEGIVVTAEKDIATQKKVTIPRVCRDRGMRSLTVLEFLREQGWQFRS